MTMAQATAARPPSAPRLASEEQMRDVIASTKAITGATAWARAGLFRCDGRER